MSLSGFVHQNPVWTTCGRPPSRLQKRNFTSIPRTRRARSPQRVALPNQKTQLYQHSAHSTRTISAEGSHFESVFQKHWACHEIIPRGHTKCCIGHATSSSGSGPKNDKNASLLRNRALRPQTIASMVRIHCACHVTRSPSNKVHKTRRLPGFSQSAPFLAPAS